MTKVLAVTTSKVDTTSRKLQIENVILDADTTVDGNVVKNITYGNFKALTAADKGKTFIVGDDGTWGLGVVAKSFEQVDALPATGDADKLYYLKADIAGGKSKGLYVWNGTEYISPVSASATVTTDNVTINTTGEGKLQVMDGTESTGITVAKMNTTAVAGTISAKASAVNTKLTTELAVATSLESKLSFDSGSSSKAFTVGKDSDGHYYILE